MYWDSDIDSSALSGKTVAVLGYGSQGRGQALNLRDSGLNVVVGLRENGPTWKQAEGDGFEPLTPANAVAKADLVAMLVPDLAQAAVYESAVRDNIKDGAALLFSHGFNIHFQQIVASPSIDVVMIAPKGPGRLVRRTFEEGGGVPCLVAVAQDSTGSAKERALAYGQALGGGKAGIIETTFAEETETDLFGEQAVLCGGATELIKAGFETLVEAGYQPEVAYFECLHELKLIVDLIYEGGFTKMHEFVSETAIFGDLTRGPRIVTSETKAEMKKILEEIQDGVFASEWISENQAGKPRYHALQNKDLCHQIETVGKEIRKQMSWLDTEK